MGQTDSKVGFAHSDSDGVRLQQLRDLLPCDVTVRRLSHPLCGERLAALNFQRKGGELRLVVVFPDGTPGMIAAADTDVFGEPASPVAAPTPLSVEGVRRFRVLVEARLVGVAGRRRARPWKVVRHKTGVDPFHQVVELCSSHTTEQAAVRARYRVRAAVVNTAGYEVAARWEWAVVNDPAGLLGGPVEGSAGGRG